MAKQQFSLFGAADGMPEGFRYHPEFLTSDEEAALAATIAALPLAPFEFQGFLGKRRVVSFGWKYDFNEVGLRRAKEIPPFLAPLRGRAAEFAGVEADSIRHVLVTEYAAGAGIGWHRDRSVFGETIGVSLLAPARLRFRRREGGKWKRAALIAEPRSAYLLSGASRSEWEHSIPEVEALRYSITFRNFAAGKAPRE